MFFIIPIGVDYQTRRYPVVTFTLMGINVAIYLLTLVFFFQDMGKDVENSIELKWILATWLIPAKSAWYTYFTTMFVHEGFWHLLGNMIYLFLFGSCVEDMIGRGKYIALYLIGGFVATFTYIACIPDHFESLVPLGGASGAISACMGAFLILLPKRKIEFKFIAFFFFRFFNYDFMLPSWLVMSFWFLEDLFFTVISDDSEGGTSFAAHVGGFVGGVGLAFLCKLLLAREERAEQALELSPIPVASSEPPTIYIFENGAQLGPFTRMQIVQMRTLGSVSPEAVYWEDGMPDWLTTCS